MKRQFLLFILCLLTLKTFANDGKKQEIDSIISKTKEYHKAVKILPMLESAIKALNLANINKYDEGKAMAHFWVAEALLNVGLPKEAFTHLESVQKTNYYNEKLAMQSETHRLKGKVYIVLKLYQQAIRELYLQLACTRSLTGEQQKKSYLHAFGNLSTAFDRLGKLDSVEKYTKLQLDGLYELDEKENVFIYLGVYDDLGSYYTKKGDFTKAKHYLDKSLALVERYNVPLFYNTMSYLGNLEQEKGNYKKALTFFDKSLANKIKVGNRRAVRNSYRFLADYYQYYKLGNAKADEYERSFSRLNDSLENEDRQLMDAVLSQILNSKDQESATKVSKAVKISIIALLLLALAVSYFVWRSKHNRKILGQKEEALQETETINRELTEQIGENKFNNLIELAKSNNPEFLTLFAELYPQFIQALKTLDPNIRTTELEFCAMAFLNFSTKNIAEYTFVTVRAVQVRKNRLRKKLEIPSDADFNTWMRGLAEKEDR